MFRKILVQSAQSDSNETKERSLGYLKTFIPALLTQLTENKNIDVKVEAIHTLTQICDKYPAPELQKYMGKVNEALHALIDDKKRVVRKFARNCLNDWLMM